MFELIRYDVINGKRKQFKDVQGTVIGSKKELNDFRAKIQAEYPDYEVYLTYRDLRTATPATA